MKTCIIILSAAFASFSIAGPVTKRLRKDIPSATELCGPFHGNDKACHYALGQCMLKKPKDIETLLQCVHAAADGVVGRPCKLTDEDCGDGFECSICPPDGGIDCKPGIQGICRRKEQQKQPEENKEQQQPEENKEQQQPEENKKQQQQQKQPEENKKKKSRPPFFAPGTDWHRSGKLTILVPRWGRKWSELSLGGMLQRHHHHHQHPQVPQVPQTSLRSPEAS